MEKSTIQKACAEPHCLNDATGLECNGDVCSEHARARITGSAQTQQERDRITGLSHFQHEQKRLSKAQEYEDTEELEASDEWREPLEYRKEESVYIMLSTGGGEDGYKIHFRYGEVSHGEYIYKDWGTFNAYDLSEEELKQVIDLYMYGDAEEYLRNQ